MCNIIICSFLIFWVASPVIAALFLILIFLLISFMLFTLGIYYIGLLYLIIYAGAIAILFLFMLFTIDFRAIISLGLNYVNIIEMLVWVFIISWLFLLNFDFEFNITVPVWVNYYRSYYFDIFVYGFGFKELSYLLFGIHYYIFISAGILLLLAMLIAIRIVLQIFFKKDA